VGYERRLSCGATLIEPFGDCLHLALKRRPFTPRQPAVPRDHADVRQRRGQQAPRGRVHTTRRRCAAVDGAPRLPAHSTARVLAAHGPSSPTSAAAAGRASPAAPPPPAPYHTAMCKLRIGRIGIRVGDELTPPFHDNPFSKTVGLVPRATRTTRTFGRRDSFKGQFLSPRAKPYSSDTLCIRRTRNSESKGKDSRLRPAARACSTLASSASSPNSASALSSRCGCVTCARAHAAM
jgi:hypothetical protein